MAVELETRPCGVWEISREAYHADSEWVSHSALRDFGRSVLYYHGRHVAGTIAPPEPTPAMRFGSALHCLVLEPETWEKRYAVAPEGIDRRTKQGKWDWTDFETRAAGREIVTAADDALLQAMREGVLANRHARAALEADGHVERALRWQCTETGLPVKCLPDKVLSTGLIVDLKTTADPCPEPWAKSVVNFGYHTQAAHYLAGCWEAVQADGPFLFIAVGKEPPHECVCYTLDDAALDLGRDSNQRLLLELAERRAKSNWAGRWSEVQVTTLPRWAFYQN